MVKKVLARTVSQRDRSKKEKLKVKHFCLLFGISYQGYYQRIQREQQRLEVEKIIVDLVKTIRKEQPRVGGKKLHVMLKDQLKNKNIKIGRDGLFKILKAHHLLVKKKKRQHITTNSKHMFYKHSNLIKALRIDRSEQVWASDITYIKTQQGYLYLSLVTDVYSKKIMGYQLSDNMKTESTLEAMKMALKIRQYPERQLIHHSDRGIQYCNPKYTNYLDLNNVKISMTQNSDPYENAVAERVNGILKDEFGIGNGFINAKQAHKEITRAINVYNKKRLHLSCDLQTPMKAHKLEKHEPKNYKIQP